MERHQVDMRMALQESPGSKRGSLGARWGGALRCSRSPALLGSSYPIPDSPGLFLVPDRPPRCLRPRLAQRTCQGARAAPWLCGVGNAALTWSILVPEPEDRRRRNSILILGCVLVERIDNGRSVRTKQCRAATPGPGQLRVFGRVGLRVELLVLLPCGRAATSCAVACQPRCLFAEAMSQALELHFG